MRQAIEKLQNQPHAVRTRVALMVAAVVTGIIGVIILTTLPLRFADSADTSNTAAVINATGNAAADQIGSMQDSWAAISQGLQVTEDSSVSAQNQTTVPGQDAPQDSAFPQDGASTVDTSY
jgi:hypothetical protein